MQQISKSIFAMVLLLVIGLAAVSSVLYYNMYNITNKTVDSALQVLTANTNKALNRVYRTDIQNALYISNYKTLCTYLQNDNNTNQEREKIRIELSAIRRSIDPNSVIMLFDPFQNEVIGTTGYEAHQKVLKRIPQNAHDYIKVKSSPHLIGPYTIEDNGTDYFMLVRWFLNEDNSTVGMMAISLDESTLTNHIFDEIYAPEGSIKVMADTYGNIVLADKKLNMDSLPMNVLTSKHPTITIDSEKYNVISIHLTSRTYLVTLIPTKLLFGFQSQILYAIIVFNTILILLVIFFYVSSIVFIKNKFDKAKENLELSKERAIESSRIKSNFLIQISHELKTPLNGIIGMNKLALMANTDEKIAEYINKSQDSANNLLNVVSDLLDYAEMDAKTFKLNLSSISLQDVFSDAINVYEPLILSKGIEFNQDIDMSTFINVYGDYTHLVRILDNLLLNSKKFTAHGTITLSARKIAGDDDNITIRIIIEDTGVGIDEKKIDNIFEAFQQADGSYSRLYSGAGIGLSVVRALVELMGGTISLESKLNIGTKVTIDIPFDIDNSTENLSGAKQDSVNFNALKAMLEDSRLLLVDDNDINLAVLSNIISKICPNFDTATSGVDALELTKTNKYDFIFMDIQMPNIDGLEATRLIRNSDSINKDTVIIAVSANSMTEDINASLESGMNYHIPKPIKINELYTVLYKYLV